jgi:acetyl esterase/lipase
MIWALALAGASWPALAMAEDLDATAARFGARPTVLGMSLAPDGKHIAYLTPTNTGGAAVNVIDVDSGMVKTILASDRENSLRSCAWVSVSRLACQIRLTVNDAGQLIGFSRVIGLNADGSKLKQISAQTGQWAVGLMQDGGRIIDGYVPGKPGYMLMTRKFVGEATTGTLVHSGASGLGVEEIDTETGARHTVIQPRQGGEDYISDGHGNVRIMAVNALANSEYMETSKSHFLYRTTDSPQWRELGNVVQQGGRAEGFEPVAVDVAKNVAYGLADKDGRQALYSITLDGSLKRELVMARPDVDVDGLIQIGRHQRVVGVSYATEHRHEEIFDPELRRLSDNLAKALPGNLTIDVEDSSEDESKLLLRATSDVDPGKFYLLDRTSHKLAPVLPVYASLDGVTLGEMKSITYPAADGTMIPAYLTVPPGSSGKGLPAIVMPHGGPNERDQWGFNWLVQFYVARGFAVLQPNYRGSAGYGADWWHGNAIRSWKLAIGDVNDAGRWLLQSGIAAPGKLAIVGWSYGGYAALQSSVLDPDLFKAVVAVAPVTDFDRWRDEWRNFTIFRIVDEEVGHGPYIEEGSPARHAAVFKAPVLLFHGDKDQNVGVEESRLMKNRLESAGKQVAYIEFPGLDHQLDDGAARHKLLATSDRFLRKALSIP